MATYYFFLRHLNVASSCSLTNSFSSFLHLMWSPSRTPSFISASRQRQNRTNLRKTTHQIQFPKQCILKFWTMRSENCQLPFVTSVQSIQSFGSIFLLQITLERTNDTINSLGRGYLPPDFLATSITNFDNQYFSDRASISAAISSLKAVTLCES